MVSVPPRRLSLLGVCASPTILDKRINAELGVQDQAASVPNIFEGAATGIHAFQSSDESLERHFTMSIPMN